MATLNRVRVSWTGQGLIGPGVSTHYFTDAAAGYVADVTTFYQAIKGRLPGEVTITIPSAGDQIDSVTGELTGAWTDGTSTSFVGTGTAQFAMGVGGRVQWQTGTFANGQRIKGSTFLVPLDAAAFAMDGTISVTVAAELQTAANALVTNAGGALTIFSRPRAGLPGGTAAVLSATVSRDISWLRTRRT